MVSENERGEIIGWLLMWTTWNKAAFDKMSNRELLVMYERYNKLNKG